MRSTVTFDADIAHELAALRAHPAETNQTFETPTFSLGESKLASLDNIQEVLATLEGDAHRCLLGESAGKERLMLRYLVVFKAIALVVFSAPAQAQQPVLLQHTLQPGTRPSDVPTFEVGKHAPTTPGRRAYELLDGAG